MKEDTKIICPECNNDENFHFNYDWSLLSIKIIDIICNECGYYLDINKFGGE